MMQFEWIRFYWRLFASILVASVNPALNKYLNIVCFILIWANFMLTRIFWKLK